MSHSPERARPIVGLRAQDAARLICWQYLPHFEDKREQEEPFVSFRSVANLILTNTLELAYKEAQTIGEPRHASRSFGHHLTPYAKRHEGDWSVYVVGDAMAPVDEQGVRTARAAIVTAQPEVVAQLSEIAAELGVPNPETAIFEHGRLHAPPGNIRLHALWRPPEMDAYRQLAG